MDNQQYRKQEKPRHDWREKQQNRQQELKQEHVASGNHCPHCGAAITATCELCPVCGKPIDDTVCSFCGTPFEGDEPFCAECGSPRSGIKCPKCGTLSFRSFCGKCNAPLNDNAAEALAAAKADPRFQRAQQLQQEMEQMEAYLYELKEDLERAMADDEAEGEAPEAPGLSAEGEKLRNQYAQLMQLLGQQPMAQQKPKAMQSKPRVERKRQLKAKFYNAEDVMASYRKKQAEMEQTLKAMLPDANMTPAQQRDYACAHKVAIITTQKGIRPTVWECNFCHCLHSQPSECAEPWHGGVWHHEEFTIETKVWDYLK